MRVEMEYDAKYDVPADAKAVIVTPTLVADRFVQLTPAYDEGRQGRWRRRRHPAARTPASRSSWTASTPACADLTEALGPNGVNKDGTLDHTLRRGPRRVRGQRRARQPDDPRPRPRRRRPSARAAATCSTRSARWPEFTEVLAKNDAVVRAFMKDLAAVSAALADERDELPRRWPRSPTRSAPSRRSSSDNRKALVTDLEKLTRVLKTINSEKESIDTALTVAPVAIGNLVLAFDTPSGSIGSRIGVSGNIWDLDGFLCAVVQQSGMPAVEQGPRLHALRADRRVGRCRARPRSARRSGRPRPRRPRRRPRRDPRAPRSRTPTRRDERRPLDELLGGAS